MTEDSATTAMPVEERFFATPELEAATARFFGDAVDDTMAQRDPIFGKLRRLPLPEGVTDVDVEVDRSSVASPSVSLSHEERFDLRDVTQGNVEEFHRIVVEVADAFLDSYMPAFFAHVGVATAAVGNSVDYAGRPFTADDLLNSFDRVEWMVDDRGLVLPPQVYAGAEAGRKIDALPPLTSAQRDRFVCMWVRKQEEHVSRGRSRRLRREPDREGA